MTFSKEQIVELILSGRAISITRCGDGEGIVLNATENFSSFQIACDSVLKRQMGYSPTVDEVQAIRNNLISAYNECDVIGIPMHKQETNSHWKKVYYILNSNTTNKEVYCDIDVAYQMLQDDSYKRILQNRKILNYISCRDLDEGFHQRWNVGRVNRFAIAPEAKFTSGYEGEVHYPTQFNKVQRWMDVMIERHPASLLFVGAGVIGKIYCNWWRDRGGIAMDVGGVMDLWAGRVTRGPERGLDKEDNTYRL